VLFVEFIVYTAIV